MGLTQEDLRRGEVIHRLFRIVDVHLGRYRSYREILEHSAALASDSSALRRRLKALQDATTEAERDRALKFLRGFGPDLSEGYLLAAAVDEFHDSEPWGGELISFLEGCYYHPPAEPALLEMIVVSAVSNLEALLAALIRGYYNLEPHALLVDSKKDGLPLKEFSLADVLSGGSIAGLKGEAIARRVRTAMGGGIDQQRKFLKSSLGLDMRELAMDWSHVQEIVLRRHAIVHNAGLATQRYAASSGGPAAGSRIDTDQDYVAGAIDELSVLGLLVSIEVLRRYPVVNRGVRHRAAAEATEAIMTQRWAAAAYLSRRELESHEAEPWRCATQRVNAWLAEIELYGLDARRDEIQAWDAKAFGALFELAKLCLLDQRDDAMDLLTRLMEAGLVSSEAFLHWPLFVKLRTDERFGLPDVEDPELPSTGELTPWLDALSVEAGPAWDEPMVAPEGPLAVRT